MAVGGHLTAIQAEKWAGFEEKERTAKRSIVKDFSKKSRGRLLRLLASIDQKKSGQKPTFLTGSYPGEYSQDWQVWKKHLHHFIVLLTQKWPRVWGVWRLEFQKRGAPHFHFLLWGGPILEDVIQVFSQKHGKMIWIGNPKNPHNQEIYTWMSQTWYRVVGSGDEKHLKAGTRIEPIRSWNGVMWYASKYLSKLTSGEFVPEGYAGRYWGVIHKSLFPIEMMSWPVSESTFFKIRRVLRKKMEKKIGKRFKLDPDSGLSSFMGNEESCKLLEWGLGEKYDPTRHIIRQRRKEGANDGKAKNQDSEAKKAI